MPLVCANPNYHCRALRAVALAALTLLFSSASQADEAKKLAYLVSDLRIPFWEIMSRGIRAQAEALGYRLEIYSAENNKKSELENTVTALKGELAGLVVSPINSSTAVTILRLARRAGVPVVVSDIGADSGEYVTYISSDNVTGAYDIGRVLAARMSELGWDTGTVGIVAIPQERANGQARTAGFMRAMTEAGIKGAGIRQQVDFSYRETYDHAAELIRSNPNLRALWLQGSDRYQGALDAIADTGRKGEILLLCFDAEPQFLQLIPQGVLVGAAMQQPLLMGEKAVQALHDHLGGKKVQKNLKLPILAISARNIHQELPLIRRNVLGLDETREQAK
jgi:ribose transport system substrate-binding protein